MFYSLLDFILNLFLKKKTFPLSFSPSLASLYLFEQWLRLGVTSTSSVWSPLQDEALYVFPNSKSFWIKASAKWLNVNVMLTQTKQKHIVCLLMFLSSSSQVSPQIHVHKCCISNILYASHQWVQAQEVWHNGQDTEAMFSCFIHPCCESIKPYGALS